MDTFCWKFGSVTYIAQNLSFASRFFESWPLYYLWVILPSTSLSIPGNHLFLSWQICLFWEAHINWIKRYHFLWLLHTTVISRFVYLVAWINTSFLSESAYSFCFLYVCCSFDLIDLIECNDFLHLHFTDIDLHLFLLIYAIFKQFFLHLLWLLEFG